MPLVEKRYAEALVSISSQGGLMDVYQQEFRNIVNVFNTQQDFRFFLLNPEVRKDIKKEVIRKIFESKVRTELVNFLLLLLDKERIKILPGILDEFVKIADQKRNILNMTIISSTPLDDSQISQMKEKYRVLYSASSVKVDVQVDPSLIGGVKVKIGDKVVDGSLKGRLESLKNLLLKA